MRQYGIYSVKVSINNALEGGWCFSRQSSISLVFVRWIGLQKATWPMS